MGTRERSPHSVKPIELNGEGAAFENQKKEERVLDEEYTEPLAMYEGGAVDMEFVGNRLAESGKSASFSGNNGYGPSQNGASGGEGSSNESCDPNRGFTVTEKRMLIQMNKDGAVQNNAIIQCRGTNTDLKFLDFGVNCSEIHWTMGMGFNVSSCQAKSIKEDYDERAEKRKQSKRESAKRSRLRRQKECEKLQAVAELLQSEIDKLPEDLRRLSEECVELQEENDNIMDQLEKTYGPDVVSDLGAIKVEHSVGKSKNTELKSPSRDNSTLERLALGLGLPLSADFLCN